MNAFQYNVVAVQAVLVRIYWFLLGLIGIFGLYEYNIIVKMNSKGHEHMLR